MTISGEDFNIKGVPAHAMVIKPCKTASQVSLHCYVPHDTKTQGESTIRGTILKGHRWIFNIGDLKQCSR